MALPVALEAMSPRRGSSPYSGTASYEVSRRNKHRGDKASKSSSRNLASKRRNGWQGGVEKEESEEDRREREKKMKERKHGKVKVKEGKVEKVEKGREE